MNDGSDTAPSGNLSIFISHSWHNESLYDELTALLTEEIVPKWTDLSIPRSRGLNLLTSGEKALLQEVELQEQMIAAINYRRSDLVAQLDKLDRSRQEKERELDMRRQIAESDLEGATDGLVKLASQEKQLQAEENLEKQIEKAFSHIEDLRNNGSGERLITAEEEYLKELKKRLQDRDSVTLQQRHSELKALMNAPEAKIRDAHTAIQAIEEERSTLRPKIDLIQNRIKETDKEIEFCQIRITKLEQDEAPEMYNVFQRTKALFSPVKGNTQLALRFPTLSLAIYERITRADIVLVIASMYD